LAEKLCEISKFYSHFLNSGLNLYDIRTSNTTIETYPPSDYKSYLAKPEIITAIGALKNYTMCSNDSTERFIFQGDL